MLILADTRENNGANPFLDICVMDNNREYASVPSRISGGDIQFRIKQITVGDYCILLRDKTNPSNIITAMVIERKTWKDLGASMKDGRMQEQHPRLYDLHRKKGCYALYIIEGAAFYKDDTEIANMPFRALHTKIRHNLLRGIPFLHTKDEAHTARMITLLARDLMKMYANDEINFPKQAPISLPENKYNDYQNYINEIRKLNNKYASLDSLLLTSEIKVIKEVSIEQESIREKEEQDFQVYEIKETEYQKDQIPKELTETKTRTDAEILNNMWSAVPGVSAKSAMQIANILHIREALTIRDDTMLTVKNKIANCEYPSGKKFGFAKANTIINMLSQIETQIKIMSEITGITDVTAKLILEKYPIRDICNGFVIAENIAEIKNKTRKIGMIPAENVIRLLRKSS
jgi:ERCC4-type nuclease